MAAGVTKICVLCGEDVANKPRTKDRLGRYFCNPCWGAATRKKVVSSPSTAEGDDINLDVITSAASEAAEVRQDELVNCPMCGAMVILARVDPSGVCRECATSRARARGPRSITYTQRRTSNYGERRNKASSSNWNGIIYGIVGTSIGAMVLYLVLGNQPQSTPPGPSQQPQSERAPAAHVSEPLPRATPQQQVSVTAPQPTINPGVQEAMKLLLAFARADDTAVASKELADSIAKDNASWIQLQGMAGHTDSQELNARLDEHRKASEDYQSNLDKSMALLKRIEKLDAATRAEALRQLLTDPDVPVNLRERLRPLQ